MKDKVRITIDGPAGAGKSTLAKLLAQKLGYLYLDTGAMYRAVALAAYKNKIPLQDEQALTLLCEGLDLELKPSEGGLKILLEGEDVSQEIRTPLIDRLSSLVARVPGVRACLKKRQRRLGEQGGVVAEGRDMGSHVFPEAHVKFFLTATPEIRAQRRYEELIRKGLQVSYEETLREVLERDQRDQEREIAPLKIPQGAIVIDSSRLSPSAILQKMLHEIEKYR